VPGRRRRWLRRRRQRLCHFLKNMSDFRWKNFELKMTQTNNYFPTFLVAIFYQRKNDQLSQGWGFCVTAAGQPPG
jgi:hypothetical protein